MLLTKLLKKSYRKIQKKTFCQKKEVVFFFVSLIVVVIVIITCLLLYDKIAFWLKQNLFSQAFPKGVSTAKRQWDTIRNTGIFPKAQASCCTSIFILSLFARKITCTSTTPQSNTINHIAKVY